jgi:hypothetical protein
MKKSISLEGAMRVSPRSENWQDFYDSARHNTVLDERTTVMLHLASALALGCYP